MTTVYPRDMVGYGANPPHPKWPGDARIALQIVMNYEEGSEYSIPDGDNHSETYLWEVPGASMGPGNRDLIVESVYEYGSRSGFWRLMRLFAERDIKITVFGAALALERNPEAADAIVGAGYDICCHGWRWIGYHLLSEEEEREHIQRAIKSLEKTTGSRPLGWYCRYAPSLNTRNLIVEEGGFLYDSDAYNDDLPYWVEVEGKPHLVIPYTLDNNDMKFSVAPGFNSGDDFFTYLKDAFDVLYKEGEVAPKMMSVGLHTRLAGRPGRTAALARFLDYVQKHEKVWICRRIDIAEHWIKNHPYQPK
ncbi:allantoinase PuuE [Planktothrix sp. FACHB-1355]|uniref:Allantoinase PuuE n=1 Tax=Aerosakkonema funiforme FACHB-1375 TaxID=2949571 RepID=A0A926VDU0_9CYAN|nr:MULTISPECIES: allantoinase PuuE [Oscillatoriales]MBD2182021.1 allantoinase PuuE [Aerosakkonema funiforme FACHB-1375]MBD3559665.1 allantoinase PuuE [Planktothrix sp. FACHB-1355]